ncbi:hypothetical protein [Nostoc sp. LPT]|uniref:hypothetical protein n=1 Tax=Nostoc sp. LPT TaxID=2815387 RepID=UPI001D6F33CD|nr:hypothetical protein [Nostoc sp. LPT]MBN4003591.1 hypothetical protein [Nostoc sp. LPT]
MRRHIPTTIIYADLLICLINPCLTSLEFRYILLKKAIAFQFLSQTECDRDRIPEIKKDY